MSLRVTCCTIAELRGIIDVIRAQAYKPFWQFDVMWTVMENRKTSSYIFFRWIIYQTIVIFIGIQYDFTTHCVKYTRWEKYWIKLFLNSSKMVCYDKRTSILNDSSISESYKFVGFSTVFVNKNIEPTVSLYNIMSLVNVA